MGGSAVVYDAISPEGIFSKGGVELTLDLTSLRRSLDEINELSDEQLAAILAAYGQEVGEGQPRRVVAFTVQSYLQQEWYQRVKGEIPMATNKGHNARTAATRTAAKAPAPTKSTGPSNRGRKAAATGDGNGKPPRPKKEKAPTAGLEARVYVLSDKTDVDAALAKARGQRKYVIEALRKARGEVTLAKVVEMVEAAGLTTKGAGGLKASVDHHLAALVNDRIAVHIA